jgi:hypothetical protein
LVSASVCGAFNGLLVTGLGLPSIVVTIGTMSLFRGIAFIILGDQAYGAIPRPLPISARAMSGGFCRSNSRCLRLAAVYCVLLHATNFGRRVYAIGNNEVWQQFSGIRVGRIKFILFLPDRSDVGHRCSSASPRASARRGRPSPRAMSSKSSPWWCSAASASLAAPAPSGRRARRLHHGLVTFGLGLLNVPGIVMSIFIGLLLILRHRAADPVGPLQQGTSGMSAEKFAFKMKLNPGMKAEYIKRHDGIWPELVTLLRDAGVSDYSIHLDDETNTLFGVLWRRADHSMDALPTIPS